MNEQMETMIPLIKMIVEKLEKKINHDLKEYGITFSQIRIVILLYHSVREDYAMKELEEIFQVSQQTMAGIINRLEKKKLVQSYHDPVDHRVKRIRLTDEGKNMGERVYGQMARNEEWVERSLTAEEREELIRLLQKIYLYAAGA